MIPVYNGSRTISRLAEQTINVFGSTSFEIVLVNDSSEDDSENACADLRDQWWCHYTVHPTPLTKQRIRASPGTKSLAEARLRRDQALFTQEARALMP